MGNILSFDSKQLIFLASVSLMVFKPPFDYPILHSIIILFISSIMFLYMMCKKISIYSYILLLILLYLYVTQGVLHGITSSFPLIVQIFGLMLLNSQLRNGYINFNYASYNYNTIIIVIVLSVSTLSETHIMRYSTFNGDPNYTALVLLTCLLLLLNMSETRFKFFLIMILIFVVLYMTMSRTAVLAVMLYFLVEIIRNVKIKYFTVILVIIFSVISQFIFAYVLDDILAFLAVESMNSRLLNLYDASNISRLDAYKSAIDTILENYGYFLFNGARFYSEWNFNNTLIPHNWFIQSVFGYGFLFTLLYLIIVVFFLFKLKFVLPNLLSFAAFCFTFAGVLNIYALQIPFMVIVFYNIISNENSGKI